jgi:hypothetical protein
LTNKAELHIAKRHPDNKAAKIQRTSLKAKRVTHAQTIHESFQRGSDLSLGSNADRLFDSARIAQSRYYVYGRGKISKETFDDEYFREMLETQYAAGIAVATAAASARVTRSSAFAAHGGHGGASPAAPRSATAAPRDGSASPAARSAGTSPAASDGSASPAARDGSASPAARGAGASPAARKVSASSLVILGGGASPGQVAAVANHLAYLFARHSPGQRYCLQKPHANRILGVAWGKRGNGPAGFSGPEYAWWGTVGAAVRSR